jgi:hypothetical protein
MASNFYSIKDPPGSRFFLSYRSNFVGLLYVLYLSQTNTCCSDYHLIMEKNDSLEWYFTTIEESAKPGSIIQGGGEGSNQGD